MTKILAIAGVLFTITTSQAFAYGNFYHFLRCDLIGPNQQNEMKTLATTGPIALGPHGEKFSTTLYDLVHNEAYVYVDVKPLGYEGSYNSELSIVFGELPEDSGKKVERYKHVVDSSIGIEGQEMTTFALVAGTTGISDFIVKCVVLTEFDQD